MKIQLKAKTKNKNTNIKTNLSRKKIYIIAVFTLFFLASVLLLGFYLGVKYRVPILKELELRGFTKGTDSFNLGAKTFIRSLPKMPERYFASSSIAKININIKFKHLSKLYQKRDEAIKKRALITADDDYVPAEIQYKNKLIPVKIRLKGDGTDHLLGDKMSMRIQVKGDGEIFGMRRFSLQAPYTKGYQAEALFHDHMRSQKIIAPRYFFIEAKINGASIGVMALEEHFSKEIQEFNEKKESVAFRFDESYYWQSFSENNDLNIYDSHMISIIREFDKGHIAKSPLLKEHLRVAIGLVRGFLDGKLSVEEVFDIETFAKFFATIEVWNAPHSLGWQNMRFYYNPISARIEPISYDADVHHVAYFSSFLMRNDNGTLTSQMMKSEKMREAYVRNLKNIISDILSGDTIDYLRKKEKEYLSCIYTESPMVDYYNLARLVQRAKSLQGLNIDNFSYYQPCIPNENFNYFTLLNSYIISENQNDYLEIHNITNQTVEVTAINANFPVTIHADFPFEISPTNFREAPTTKKIMFVEKNTPEKKAEDKEIIVVAKIKGKKELQNTIAKIYYSPLVTSPLANTPMDSCLSENECLTWNEQDKTFYIKSGDWIINKYIVFPKNTNLEIESGTSLKFAEDAGLVIQGALNIQGSEEKPIIMDALDEKKWRGFVVLGENETSEISYLHVKNTKGHQLINWSLTGAITFYKNDISIKNCIFENNTAEDVVNIIHSNFVLENVSIFNTTSDALDTDFANGKIINCTFGNIKGDAIDISGTKLFIDGAQIYNVKDKAVSVGEKSNAEAINLNIKKCGTGIAVKDLSYMKLAESKLEEIEHFALMAYIKKKEYGPGKMDVTNINGEWEKSVVVQTGSKITIDGKEIEAQNIDIDKIYKEGFMKKN